MSKSIENVFVQNNHGMPGIGSSKKAGSDGKRGPSIFFGLLNDFFNSENVSIDSNVRVARTSDDGNAEYYTGLRTSTGHNVDLTYDGKSQFTLITDINGHESEFNFQVIDGTSVIGSPYRGYVDMGKIPYEYDDPSLADEEFANGKIIGVDTYSAVYNNGTWSIVPSASSGISYGNAEDHYLRTHIQEREESIKESFRKKYQDIDDWNDADLRDYAGGHATPEDFKNLVQKEKSNDIAFLSRFNIPKTSYDESVSIIIPTSLKDEFVPGDILYIWSDEDSFKLSGQIEYMICVTEDMIGQSSNYVLNKALQINPFLRKKFQDYDFNGTRRLYTSNKFGVVRLESIDASIDKEVQGYVPFYKNNFSKSSMASDFKLIISEFNTDRISAFLEADHYDNSENERQILNQLTVSYHQAYKVFDNIDSDAIYIWAKRNVKESDISDEDSQHDESSSDIGDSSLYLKTRFSSLYVNNSTITNIDLADVTKPLDINFDNNDFIQGVTASQLNFADLTGTISKASLFKDTNDMSSYSVGVIVADASSGKSEEFETSGSLLEFKFLSEEDAISHADSSMALSLITYLKKDYTSKYFSRPTDLNIEFNSDGQVSRYQVGEVDYDFSSSIEEVQEDSQIIFSIDPISCDVAKGIQLSLSVKDSSSTIDKVYFNGSEYQYSNPEALNFSWIDVSLMNVEHQDGDDSSEVVRAVNFIIDVSSNYPMVTDMSDPSDPSEMMPATAEEYFSAYDDSKNLEENYLFDRIKNGNLYSTASRTIDCDVMYHTVGIKEIRMAHFKIMQPGFKDERTIPILNLVPMTSLNEMESCNDASKGILCSQFQYFVRIEAVESSIKAWMNYFPNLTFDIEIQDNHIDEERVIVGNVNNVHNANLQFIIEDSSNILESTWIREHLSVTTQSIDASIRNIEAEEIIDNMNDENDNRFKVLISHSAIELCQDEDSGGMTIDSQWIDEEDRRLSFGFARELESEKVGDKSYLYSRYKYQGVLYNDTIKISGLSYDDLQSGLKIRDFIEFSNPFNAIWQRNFVIKKIVIHTDASHGMAFTYNPYVLESEAIESPRLSEMQSGFCKFILNPISLKAYPKDLESSRLYQMNTNEVVITGPEDLMAYGPELYDAEALSELGVISYEASMMKSEYENIVYLENQFKKTAQTRQARAFSINLSSGSSPSNPIKSLLQISAVSEFGGTSKSASQLAKKHDDLEPIKGDVSLFYIPQFNLAESTANKIFIDDEDILNKVEDMLDVDFETQDNQQENQQENPSDSSIESSSNEEQTTESSEESPSDSSNDVGSSNSPSENVKPSNPSSNVDSSTDSKPTAIWKSEIFDRLDIIRRYDFGSVVWNDNIPRIEILQDDVKSIDIVHVDPFQMKDIVSAKEDFNYFLSLSDDDRDKCRSVAMTESSGLENAKFLPFNDLKTNIYEEGSYFMFGYNHEMMRPRERDGISTFYYNGDLYDSSRYDQRSSNSPCFIKIENSIECRDTEMIEAIETWNFEYENTSYYDGSATSKGNLTESGNGYLFLLNSADHGQYGEDYMPLSELKSRNAEAIPFNTYYEMPGFLEETDELPKNDELFRAFVWQAGWQYPCYQENRTIVPFMLADKEDMRQDRMLDEALMSYQYDDTESQSIDDTKFSSGYKAKRNRCQMMPYDWAYSLSTRIGMTKDKNAVHIFMLRKPSIYDDWSETLSKRYFSHSDNVDFDFKVPYKY